MRKLIFLMNIIIFQSFLFFGADTILLNYYDDSQLEIIKNDEVRILIDVWIPIKLTEGKTFKEEILLTSNHINDIFVNDFQKNFKGKQIDFAPGEIKGNDYYIKSYPTYVNEHDKYRFNKPTNYIFILDISGIRIAHFGTIGINKFSDEDLKNIGSVDIAIIQLNNFLSDMNIGNEKAFILMDQIKPKIIIPTLLSKETIEKAVTVWNGRYCSEKYFKISKEKLPKKTTLVILGNLSKAFGKTLNLKKFK